MPGAPGGAGMPLVGGGGIAAADGGGGKPADGGAGGIGGPPVDVTGGAIGAIEGALTDNAAADYRSWNEPIVPRPRTTDCSPELARFAMEPGAGLPYSPAISGCCSSSGSSDYLSSSVPPYAFSCSF